MNSPHQPRRIFVLQAGGGGFWTFRWRLVHRDSTNGWWLSLSSGLSEYGWSHVGVTGTWGLCANLGVYVFQISHGLWLENLQGITMSSRRIFPKSNSCGRSDNKKLLGGWATPLKNVKQWRLLFPIYCMENKKNVPNHQPENIWACLSDLSLWLRLPQITSLVICFFCI